MGNDPSIADVNFGASAALYSFHFIGIYVYFMRHADNVLCVLLTPIRKCSKFSTHSSHLATLNLIARYEIHLLLLFLTVSLRLSPTERFGVLAHFSWLVFGISRSTHISCYRNTSSDVDAQTKWWALSPTMCTSRTTCPIHADMAQLWNDNLSVRRRWGTLASIATLVCASTSNSIYSDGFLCEWSALEYERVWTVSILHERNICYFRINPRGPENLLCPFSASGNFLQFSIRSWLWDEVIQRGQLQLIAIELFRLLLFLQFIV